MSFGGFRFENQLAELNGPKCSVEADSQDRQAGLSLAGGAGGAISPLPNRADRRLIWRAGTQPQNDGLDWIFDPPAAKNAVKK